MNNDLSEYRKSYDRGTLVESEASKNPFNLFEKWFKDVDHFFPNNENNAMTISTVDSDGSPSSRVVLLKSFSENGFVFYTNYRSAKGQNITNNPKVCISFFWEEAERQVIIKGTAHQLDPAESDNYFKSRPRGSQLGAWASMQSSVVKNRSLLDQSLKFFDQKFKGKTIPRPEHWGGYVVVPSEFQFWQGRENRLHDRLRYGLNTDKVWVIDRLSP